MRKRQEDIESSCWGSSGPKKKKNTLYNYKETKWNEDSLPAVCNLKWSLKSRNNKSLKNKKQITKKQKKKTVKLVSISFSLRREIQIPNVTIPRSVQYFYFTFPFLLLRRNIPDNILPQQVFHIDGPVVFIQLMG